MYILNIAIAIKRFHKRHFVFEIYYKRIGFSKENSYYSIKRLEKRDLLFLPNKLIENIPDPRNAKEH